MREGSRLFIVLCLSFYEDGTVKRTRLLKEKIHVVWSRLLQQGLVLTVVRQQVAPSFQFIQPPELLNEMERQRVTIA